ncbi:hypothetical protein ABIA32_003265 [Streptacidiphilus sp. MAP12-20]|uniref:CDP-alcohol phosphatidyltransferase family protein n=1 Tax=Streptacidiphilus sp. MAP12-20 TaxID=3156299 RepID=UPI003513E04D
MSSSLGGVAVALRRLGFSEWLRRGPSARIAALAGSRAATDELLAVLHRDGWVEFGFCAAKRSASQALRRPAALAEVTALHGLFLRMSQEPGRRWTGASWMLCVTHLGLLEERRHLSAADVLSLARGNLPALARTGGRRLGFWAIALDLADGRMARRSGTTSPFGAYADTFADAAFWTWLTLCGERDPRWRRAALLLWAAPVAAVTVASLTRGRMVDAPRPALLRPAAAMQLVLAVRRWRAGRQVGGEV